MFEWFGLVNFCPATKVTEFAQHLRDGYLMASRCVACGQQSFPPRADCASCRSAEFEFTEISGEGTIMTYTQIDAAPAGFEDQVPFTIGVVDLKEGGRLLAWFGETIPEGSMEIGMPVQVVPRIFEDLEPIKVYYSIEAPGTTWTKSRTG